MSKNTRSSKPKRSPSVPRSRQKDPIVFNFGGRDIEILFGDTDAEETAPADPQRPSASLTDNVGELQPPAS